VMNPMASGIGGGGFMLVRSAQGQSLVMDMREVAPSGATQGMFEGVRRVSLTCRPFLFSQSQHGTTRAGRRRKQCICMPCVS
jgi:hypothetical protein